MPDDPVTRDDPGADPGRRPTTGISRWHIVVGILGLVVLLGPRLGLFGPGSFDHGPGGPGGEAPPAEVTDNGNQGPGRHAPGETPPTGFNH